MASLASDRIREDRFPHPLLVVIKNAGKLPELVQHAGFIMLSLIIISMARFELRALGPHA